MSDELAIRPDSSPATKPREVRVVSDDSQYLLDTARFEHMYRIATVMASGSLLPDHLARDKHGPFSIDECKGNCFRVVNQAVRWGMDPFAVAPESYVASGRLGYSGKLVAAVINARANIIRNLEYSFTGKKGTDEFSVIVSATFVGEETARTISLSVGEAKTDHFMWKKDPEQKLCYSGAVKWARRHCPEVMLGVLTDDDLEHIKATRAKPAQAQVVFGRGAAAVPVVTDGAAVSCDGNHRGDACADPECWLREETV